MDAEELKKVKAELKAGKKKYTKDFKIAVAEINGLKEKVTSQRGLEAEISKAEAMASTESQARVQAERALEQVREHSFCGVLWTTRCHIPCHVAVL